MSIFLSIFPILLLIVLMIGVKLPGDKSAVLAVLSAVLIAIFAVPNVSGFTPPQGYGASYVGWAFVEGILKAVFPILIIILMALFSYNILLESKQIEVIKQQFTNISSDKRIQVLLIVWGFGGLLEGGGDSCGDFNRLGLFAPLCRAGFVDWQQRGNGLWRGGRAGDYLGKRGVWLGSYRAANASLGG